MLGVVFCINGFEKGLVAPLLQELLREVRVLRVDLGGEGHRHGGGDGASVLQDGAEGALGVLDLHRASVALHQVADLPLVGDLLGEVLLVRLRPSAGGFDVPGVMKAGDLRGGVLA